MNILYSDLGEGTGHPEELKKPRAAAMDLSVIMGVHPTFVAGVREVFKCLSDQTLKGRFEVVVVLDGPPRGELLRQWVLLAMAAPFPVQLAHTDQEHLRTGDPQRDIGQEVATGRYFCYLDDDDQPAPWYIESMMAMVERKVEVGNVLMLRDGYVLGRAWRRGDIGGAVILARGDIARACRWNTRPNSKNPKPGDPDYATDWLFCEQLLARRGPATANIPPPSVDRVCLIVNAYRYLRPATLQPQDHH